MINIRDLTDTELEADYQAALSRLANHRYRSGDWDKIRPTLIAAGAAPVEPTR